MKRLSTELGDLSMFGPPGPAHERVGNLWLAWMTWAYALEESASYIRDRSSYAQRRGGEVVMPLTFGVRAMLLGYAIECALKGLWVKSGNKIVQGGRYVGIPKC